MGVLRRIADAAREGLTKLENRKMARIGDKPLSELTDRELDAELMRRRRLRASGRGAPPGPAEREPGSRISAAVRRASVKQWYANLELPPGAGAGDVRAQYATLLRRYDPEKHKDNPEKHRAALALVRGLTEAHDGLLAHLGEGED